MLIFALIFAPIFAPVVIFISLVAGVVSANPIEARTVTVSLFKPAIRPGISGHDITKKDKARIAKYNGVSKIVVAQDKTSSGTITNTIVSYLATVKFGRKSFNLVVDTGSSITWAGARGGYSPGSTGVWTGGTVSVQYGSGSFQGNHYTDTVCFARLCVSRQSVGIATSSSGFEGVDGILGLGPVGLTRGAASDASTVPTFTNNLKAQRSISTEIVGVYFKPESGSNTADANGELTLGGINNSKYAGNLSYVRRATNGPHAAYWGVDITSLTFGNTTLHGANGAIVDTGTTLIYLPTSAYNKFLKVTGGTTDPYSQFSRFVKKPTANFVMRIGRYSFTLTPSQYLVPIAQYRNWGFSPPYYYSWINDGGSYGLDLIIGQKFLEQYYSVFDTTKSRIGFAVRV